MDRWVNKVAVVTGTSSGIGEEIAKDLAKAGMVVIALARRVEKVQKIKEELPQSAQKLFHPIKCDITDEQQIIETFSWIVKTHGGIDVLINNAGIGSTDIKLGDEGNTSYIRDVVNTNLMGVFFCTREAFRSMRDRSFAGHVVNINSVLGHSVPVIPPQYGDINLNIYPATKYGVTALTESFRQEFTKSGCPIKITSISPGTVQTDIGPLFSKENLKYVPHLKAQDISAAVLYTLGTPEHVNVQELIIKPTSSL